MKLRLIFLVEKGTRKAAKLQIKGNCIIKIGMRKEKQFSSPPSGQGAKGKAPLGFFQAEPSPTEGRLPQSFSKYPISRLQTVPQQGGDFCSLGNKRERLFFLEGKAQPNPHKTSSSTSCPLVTTEPHLLQKFAPRETLPAVSSNLPALPGARILLLCWDEDPRLWSPDSFPATEVNDLNPRDFHLLLHYYPCVIPAISSRIKIQPCCRAAAPRAKVGPTGTQPSHCTLRGDHGATGRARSRLSPSLWESQLRALHKYPFLPRDGFRSSPQCQELLELIRQRSSLAGLLMAPN